MRKLVYLVAITLGLLGFGAAPAWADNGPHYPSSGNTAVDRCAGCHRAHTAQATYLLRDTQPALCYTCHGAGAGGASTDVFDGVGYAGFERGGTTGQALRGGGFGYALIGSGNATRVTTTNGTTTTTTKTVPVLTTGAAATSSHSVDGSMVTAWGNGAISSTASAGTAISLRCGSCHDPHGNGNYRILRPIPNESGATTGVTIADSPTKAYTTSNYWSTDDPNSPAVDVNYVSHGVPATATTTEFIANISAWCTQCHTRYLAESGSYKTSSGDAMYTYRHRSNQNYKEGGANCITCHVAHGSNASMGGTESGKVTNPDGSGPAGSSKLLRVDNRGTCNMCHRV